MLYCIPAYRKTPRLFSSLPDLRISPTTFRHGVISASTQNCVEQSSLLCCIGFFELPYIQFASPLDHITVYWFIVISCFEASTAALSSSKFSTMLRKSLALLTSDLFSMTSFLYFLRILLTFSLEVLGITITQDVSVLGTVFFLTEVLTPFLKVGDTCFYFFLNLMVSWTFLLLFAKSRISLPSHGYGGHLRWLRCSPTILPHYQSFNGFRHVVDCLVRAIFNTIYCGTKRLHIGDSTSSLCIFNRIGNCERRIPRLRSGVNVCGTALLFMTCHMRWETPKDSI